MKEERGWWVVVAVGFTVIAISLVAAWRSTRDPLPKLPEAERRALFQSNWANFANTCLATPTPALKALEAFCREQAEVLRRLPECDPACQQRTSSFTTPEPSR